MTTNERQQIARQRVTVLLREARSNGESYSGICRRAQERGHKVSTSTLSDIANINKYDQVYVSAYTAYALSDLYGVSVGYLLGGDDRPKRGIIAKLFGGR